MTEETVGDDLQEDLGTVDLSEDDLRPAPIPDDFHPAIIEKCRIERQSKDPNKRKVQWTYKLDGCDDPDLNGERVFMSTSIEKGQGFQFLKVLEGLGITRDQFNDQFQAGPGLEGIEVLIQTKQRIFNNRPVYDVVEVRPR